MPNLNVPFGGGTLITPGAYYQDDVSADLPQNAPTTPPLLFLGFGYGPVPFAINKFQSTQDLSAALRNGPAATFVPFMATPSPELVGAQNITFIDVSSNTPSQFTLSAAQSGMGNLIQITSSQYGLPSNLLQITVGGSTIGATFTGNINASAARLITIYDGYANVGISQDNLGCPFEMAYIGAGASASYQVVTATGVTAATLQLRSSNPNENRNIPLGTGQFATIAQVVAFINGTGFYTAAVLTNANLPSASLDLGSGVMPIPVGGTLSYVYPSAILADVIYWLNNSASSLVSATVIGNPVSNSGAALAAVMSQNFTGATSVPPTTLNYASGLNVATATAAWTVISDSADNGVQQLIAQHALLMSTPAKGKWRRAVMGSDLGDSVQVTISQAIALDAKEATYVYPGIQRVDQNSGAIVSRPGLYVAAAVAAMMTGNNANTPLTNKALTADGLELNNGVPVSLTLSQIDALQQAGVMPVGITDNSSVPRIISDFTTWQVDDNPENVFNQQVAERFYLAYSMVNTLKPYVGTTADPLDELKILNAAKALLNVLTYSQGNTTGIISSWDPSTLTLVYTGSNQTAAIRVNVVLVGQNRFITVTVPIQPLNLTITASAQ